MTTTTDPDPRAAARRRRRAAARGRLGGALWAAVWMFPLATPLVTVLQDKVPQPGLALAAMIVFAIVYLTVVVNGFDGYHKTAWYDYVLLAMVAVIGLTLVAAYGTHRDGWITVLIYVSVAGVAVFPPRGGIAWTASVLALLLIWGLWPRSATDIVDDVVSTAISVALASGLVFVILEMQRYIRALTATRAQLARVAVAEERERFSRDLHDLLGHTLSLIVVKAEVVRRLADRDPGAVVREAQDIEEIGRRALAEVREAVSGYREPQFATELDRARSALSDAGIVVTVTETGGPLPDTLGTPLAWAVREAATNVIRHSHARSCRIAVSITESAATLEVTDDGVGSSEASLAGTGLLGLQERFAAAGGSITTSSGAGFRIAASVPRTPVAA